MNQWIETTTIATEVNLNKDFHFENKTTENNNKKNNPTILDPKNFEKYIFVINFKFKPFKKK